MLFDEPTAARISELWSSVSEASSVRSNLWDESWDGPLAGFSACYEGALKTQSPQVWRAVVVQGRALRTALEHHAGVEHRLYVATTRVTDAVDYAMDALAKDGRGLVMPEQVGQLIVKVQHLEQTVAEDRASRKIFEVEAKGTLDEVAGKIATAKKPLVHLENVSLNPKFSLISTTLAEVAEALTAAGQPSSYVVTPEDHHDNSRIEAGNGDPCVSRVEPAAKNAGEIAADRRKDQEHGHLLPIDEPAENEEKRGRGVHRSIQ